MSNNKPSYMSTRVRASVAAILGSTLLSGYAAQSFSAEEKLEEIQVTGSRITRRDLESNSPIVSIDNAALEAKSGLNIESYLNQLPAFNPAGSPTVKGGTGSNSDVQISAVSSVGIASISLRGFGPNRGLVLMDGHRATPTNALMVVDINSVPSSMIKRVEIISGGASATYGADAIAGVSNFILRKDFQGLEADFQQGITQAGDGQETRASALMGSKFADGRGNVVFAAEYYNREAAYEKNRDFYKKGWADPTVTGNFLGFVMGVNGYNPSSNNYSPNALAGILGKPVNQVTGFPNTAGSAAIRFNTDSSIYLQVGDNASTFKGKVDGLHYSYVNAFNDTTLNSAATPPAVIQKIKWDETEGYAGSPQTRYAFMGSGQYDITDNVQFYSSARFAQSRTTTYLSGTNASLGWEAVVPYNATTDSPVNPALNFKDSAVVAAIMANPAAYANPNFIAHGAAGAQHPVPLAMAILLNSRNPVTSLAVNPLLRGDPTNAAWIAETYPLNSFASRSTVDENLAWQIEAGLKFDIPVKDWKGEVYYSRGESATYNIANGNNSLARWRGEVTANDYGYKSNLQSNKTNNPGANSGFGSVAVPCTSGFYDTLFKGDTRPSDDCLYAINAPLQTRTENQQDIGEINFQGGLFNLPAGEVRAAVGYEYRRNASQFNPDILQSTASFTDQVIGVYPTGYLNAQTKVNDYYAELLVPVLSDTFVKKVELELGGRFSDYDQTDSTTTFKVNGNIEFNDYVRLRGGFNRANRAPNLGELYLNLQQIFTGGGTYADPCSLISDSPFGAGGAAQNPWASSTKPAVLAGGQTAAGAKSAYLICQAQMGGGAFSTQGGYYDSKSPAGATAGGGFAWVNQVGNAKLKSEIADTFTAGFVLRSPWEKPLLQSLTATLDWYQISLKDAILPYSVTYAQYQCYGAVQVTDAAGAAAQAASVACQNVPRSTLNGAALTTAVSYDNQATVKTAGVDFTVNWYGKLADMGLERVPGGVSVNMQGTWLNYYKTKESPYTYDPEVNWKGSLGPTLQGFNPGAYSYRLFTNFSYVLPSASFGLRWRHLPSVVVAAKAVENAKIANNAAVTAGDTSKVLLSYIPITNEAAPAYDAFDLSANWNVTENFTVRAGIDNVFDTQPAITGKTTGYPVGTTLSGVCNGAPGCVNPASYALPTSGQGTTNGGYYDVLGRRYFVGFKAKF